MGKKRSFNRRCRTVGGWAGWLVAAVVLSFGLRSTVAQAYWIPSASMDATLQIGDHILVERPLMDVNGINPGDVVVFDRPPALGSAAPEELVKRVAGVGGDTVAARGGIVSVNGVTVVEPYVSTPTSDFGPVQVPNGQLFVMGDNRANSTDSRVFGPIPESSVVGSAFARIWPVDRLGGV